MYRKIEETRDDVLDYQLSGSLSKEEVQQMHQEIESVINEHGSARLVVEFGDMKSPEPQAIWEDLKLTPEYMTKVERYAIVGDRQWEKWTAKVTAVLAKGRVKYFDTSQLNEARNWAQA